MSRAARRQPRRPIVIVGASLAGAAAASGLREAGYDQEIVVVGDESRPPYDRTPLSKGFLAGEVPEGSTLIPIDSAKSVDWLLGVRATGLDLSERAVLLSDGRRIRFRGLIISTGAAPRVPALFSDARNAHVLRTLDDAQALRHVLDASPSHVAILGAGFIGSEVASECVRRGIDVTVLEALPAPFARSLGEEVGNLFADMYRTRGIDLRLGTRVESCTQRNREVCLRVEDGSLIRADVIVIGVGAEPAVQWLASTGLDLSNGVLCDVRCTAAESVVCAGDVARWHSLRFGRAVRIEHWDNAIRQGRFAASAVLAPRSVEAYDEIPWFWSDQFGLKVQVAGLPQLSTEVVIEGSPNEGNLLALYRLGDELVAAIGINRARDIARLRDSIRRRVGWSDALASLLGSSGRRSEARIYGD